MLGTRHDKQAMSIASARVKSLETADRICAYLDRPYQTTLMILMVEMQVCSQLHIPDSMLFSILSKRAATFSLGPALGSATTASSSSLLVLYLHTQL